MIVRRETADDLGAVDAIVGAAFRPPEGAGGRPVEVGLLRELRRDAGWIPALSLVAEADGGVIGHVVCTRGSVGDVPALGLGPIAVLPSHQGGGVGSALMHTVLGAADALGEPLVALLGDPAYYGRFGFVAGADRGVEAPEPAWGAYFQVRLLDAWTPAATGPFTYAAPFAAL